MLGLRTAVAVALTVAALSFSPATYAQSAGYDLSALSPQVSEVVIRARTAEARALGTAQRARDAAQRGAEAAQRARNGEAATSVHDQTWGEPPRSARYETEIRNDNRNGYGTQTFTAGAWAGDYFAGQFVDGRKSGLGVYRYATNQNNSQQVSYEGEWALSQQSGLGVSTWRNQDRYAGEYSNDNLNGVGVYRFANGRRIEGEFVNGLLTGIGVEWDANGRVVSQGIWTEDQITTPLSR